jgi:hypothetical protein
VKVEYGVSKRDQEQDLDLAYRSVARGRCARGQRASVLVGRSRIDIAACHCPWVAN